MNDVPKYTVASKNAKRIIISRLYAKVIIATFTNRKEKKLSKQFYF